MVEYEESPPWFYLLNFNGLGSVNEEERNPLSRSFKYAKRIADHVNKAGHGTLLAENQCRDLSLKLVKTSTNVQELVMQFECDHRDSLFKNVLEEFCVILEKAWLLVEDCSAANWQRASVFQLQNEESFREILLEVGFCYDAIYEQARWGQRVNLVKKAGEVQDLRQIGTFFPAQAHEVLEDHQTLRKRLEDWLAKNPNSSDDHMMSRYLLGRFTKYLQLMDRLKGIESDADHLISNDLGISDPILLQATETETKQMWDVNRKILSSSSGICVDATKWLGIPCAKKTFLDIDAANVSFRKEAELLAALNHPNIVKFFCCGNDLQERLQSFNDHQKPSIFCIETVSTFVQHFCSESQPIRQPGSQLSMSTHKPRKTLSSSFSSTDLQKPQCFIGMELMMMSLLDLINLLKANEMYFSSEEGLDIILQIARGMCYLHDLGVVHRDVKPGNVVVSMVESQNGECVTCVKLVDFGLSKTKIQVSKSNPISHKGCGTSIYRAPEINPKSAEGGYQRVKWFKADVFSFALTCAAILTLKEPFLDEAEHPAELLKKIVECNLRPELPKNRPNYELLPLLEMCWATDPKERPDFPSICVKLEKYKQDLLTINLRSKTLGMQCSRLAIEDASKGMQSDYIEKMLTYRSEQRSATLMMDDEKPAEAPSSKGNLDLMLGETSQRRIIIAT